MVVRAKANKQHNEQGYRKMEFKIDDKFFTTRVPKLQYASALVRHLALLISAKDAKKMVFDYKNGETSEMERVLDVRYYNWFGTGTMDYRLEKRVINKEAVLYVANESDTELFVSDKFSKKNLTAYFDVLAGRSSNRWGVVWISYRVFAGLALFASLGEKQEILARKIINSFYSYKEFRQGYGVWKNTDWAEELYDEIKDLGGESLGNDEPFSRRHSWEFAPNQTKASQKLASETSLNKYMKNIEISGDINSWDVEKMEQYMNQLFEAIPTLKIVTGGVDKPELKIRKRFGNRLGTFCSGRNIIFSESSLSVIHEYGHYLDYKAFYNISQQDRFVSIVNAYRKNFTGVNRNYYCNKREIFARGFEKYVWLKHGIGEEDNLKSWDYTPFDKIEEELGDFFDSVFIPRSTRMKKAA